MLTSDKNEGLTGLYENTRVFLKESGYAQSVFHQRVEHLSLIWKQKTLSTTIHLKTIPFNKDRVPEKSCCCWCCCCDLWSEGTLSLGFPINILSTSYQHSITIPINIISKPINILSTSYQFLSKFQSNISQHPINILSNSYQSPSQILSFSYQNPINKLSTFYQHPIKFLS